MEQGANRHHARWANFPRRLASAAAMLLGFGLLGLGLAGCGSSGTQNAELAAAPIPAGQARLTVTRTSSLLYAGAPASMTLNGKPLAELGVGGSTLANIAAGENIIAVSAWSYPGSFSIRLNAAAGRNYALEVAPRSESFGPATLLGPLGGVVDAALNQNAGAFQLRFVAGE